MCTQSAPGCPVRTPRTTQHKCLNSNSGDGGGGNGSGGDGGRMLNLRRLHLSFYDQPASVLLYQHGAILPKAKKAWGKVCSSFRHKSRESTKK